MKKSSSLSSYYNIDLDTSENDYKNKMWVERKMEYVINSAL